MQYFISLVAYRLFLDPSPFGVIHPKAPGCGNASVLVLALLNFPGLSVNVEMRIMYNATWMNMSRNAHVEFHL
jgi:hypothetical protein